MGQPADREIRLRERIDVLTDQRDHAREQLAKQRGLVQKWRVRYHKKCRQYELWRNRWRERPR